MTKRNCDKWHGYTEEDCSCEFCLYYGGKSKGEIRCLATDCVCKKELKEAIHRERMKNGSQNQ